MVAAYSVYYIFIYYHDNRLRVQVDRAACVFFFEQIYI